MAQKSTWIHLIPVLFFSLLLMSLTSVSYAENKVELKPNHPTRYIVTAGDTLWDVAAKFLTKPWQWQQLWEKNTHIRNPHILYPGNVIELYKIDGHPYLRLVSSGTVKLSPKIRYQKMYTPIPTIPIDDIKNFLSSALVVQKDDLTKYPYVIALDKERLGATMTSKVYARGNFPKLVKQFIIYKLGRPYRDPITKKILGYEAVDTAHATLEKQGDPATLLITQQKQEVRTGYRLIRDNGRIFKTDFIPRPPQAQIHDGRVAAILDKGIQSIGHLFIVALSVGKCNGIYPGHVLTVYERGEIIRDKYTTSHRDQKVKLPDTKLGEVMVFRSFQNMSFALVMQAYHLIQVGDDVRNPN